jgi:hypothetical protein
MVSKVFIFLISPKPELIDCSHYAGLHVAQIRLIFRPANPQSSHALHPHPKHLAYVEWFTPPPENPDLGTQMYAVSKLYEPDGTTRQGDIIELDSIVQPCYLAPRFGEKAARLGGNLEVDGTNSLAIGHEFWINCFQSKPTYQTIW